MVGCKYNQGYINKKRACTELIDTWWDVNVFRDVMEYGGYIELIDTWWDVNEAQKKVNTRQAEELIDTWWDVNL